MKTIKLFFAVILTVLVTTGNALHAQTNLLTNGNFETMNESGNPTGWTYGTASSVVYSVVTDAFDGAKALQVDVSSTSGSITRCISESITAEVGAIYNISFWYKILRDPSQTTGGVINNIGWVNANGIQFSNLYPSDSDTPPLPYVLDIWMPYTSGDVVAPKGTLTLAVNIAFNRAVKAIIDSVVVTKTSGSTGINETTLSLPVRKQGDNLIVSTEAGSNIDVYNALGLKLQSKIAKSSETVISSLPKAQVLIVRSGKTVTKVIL